MIERPDPEREPELLRDAKSGSTEAFSGLVWLHQGAVRAYLARCSRRSDVVDDLAQEVFVAAYRALRSYAGESSLRLWLLGIARNQWRMYLRGEERRRAREALRIEQELSRQAVGFFDQLPLEEHERELAALRGCLDRLPPLPAKVVRAHYFEGRSAVAIAEALDRKASAVRMTLLRARRELHACMQRQLPAEGV